MFLGIINTIRRKRKIKMFKRNSILNGTKYSFGRAAYVSLMDGSVPEDVQIGDNFTLNGALQSQNGGKIFIGDNVWIGENSCIQSVESVSIKGYCRISNNVFITDNNNHPTHPLYTRFCSMMPNGSDCMLWKHAAHTPVIIGENCWIGQYVRIQKGVTIGNNCIIAANSVVTKSVPDNSIAAGNPAKIVKGDINQQPVPTTDKEFNEWYKLQ